MTSTQQIPQKIQPVDQHTVDPWIYPLRWGAILLLLSGLTYSLFLGIRDVPFQAASFLVWGLPILWLAVARFAQSWTVHILFAMITLAIAALAWYGSLSLTLSLFALILDFWAWDLESLFLRIQAAGQVHQLWSLIASHLSRLAWVTLLGLALAVGARLIQVNLSFGVILLLGFLTVLGVSLGIRTVRRRKE